MSDYERYGDYDDIEEDLPKSKNPVVITLKIMIFVVCIGVIGIIAFRMIAFNSYPKTVSNVFFNDVLTSYYNEKNGEVEIKTQKLSAPYDDEDEGNFFCQYLYVIDDIDQLQITVRYNTSTVEKISKKLGIELDEDSYDLFSYRLCASYGDEWKMVGELTAKNFDSKLMYRYEKLVFDNVDISLDSIGSPYWIRLEVLVNGCGKDWPAVEEKVNDASQMSHFFMIPICENNDKYSSFKDYKLSGKEKP